MFKYSNNSCIHLTELKVASHAIQINRLETDAMLECEYSCLYQNYSSILYYKNESQNMLVSA